MDENSLNENSKVERTSQRDGRTDDGASASIPLNESYFVEYVKYWKNFVKGVFSGAAMAITLYPIVFGVIFVSVAYFIYTSGIKYYNMYLVVKIICTFVLFLVYTCMGLVCGVALGVNSRIIDNINGVEEGVHLTLEPLTASIVQKLPGGNKSISIPEFNTILDTQIRKFAASSRSRSRFLSIGGFLSRFIVRNILRVFRATIISDFLDGLKEKGEEEITAGAVEDFTRRKVAGIVVDNIRSRFEMIRYAIYGFLIVFLGGPVIVILSKGIG